MTLDLSALSFIDCSGLRALLEMRQRSQASGGDILLAALHDAVQRLLAVTGSTSCFGIYTTVSDALDSGPATLGETR